MAEERYDRNHHAGANAEERIRNSRPAPNRNAAAARKSNSAKARLER
jgi:hypothetical protein